MGLPDLTLILFECGESLILVDRADIILIILNLISSSKSGGFDPEISIFFILLDALSIRLIRNLLRRCRCGRISFIREGINFLLITIHLSLISRMVSLF